MSTRYDEAEAVEAMINYFATDKPTREHRDAVLKTLIAYRDDNDELGILPTIGDDHDRQDTDPNRMEIRNEVDAAEQLAEQAHARKIAALKSAFAATLDASRAEVEKLKAHVFMLREPLAALLTRIELDQTPRCFTTAQARRALSATDPDGLTMAEERAQNPNP